MNFGNVTDRLLGIGLAVLILTAAGCRDVDYFNVVQPAVAVAPPPPPAPIVTPTPEPTPVPVVSPTPTPTPVPVPPGSIRGTVTNAIDGLPLPGVTVVFHDATGVVVGLATTNNIGTYMGPSLPPGAYTVDFGKSGFNDLNGVPTVVVSGNVTVLNESLSPTLATGQYRVVLTWTDEMIGAVRDVDSYLIIPTDGIGFPVYYANRTGTGANLDHDDVDWSGPETVTISSLQTVGTYVYYINNYSERFDLSSLGNSHAQIIVYRGTQVYRTYQVPPLTSAELAIGLGLNWEAFRIVNGVFDDTHSQRYTDANWYSGQP